MNIGDVNVHTPLEVDSDTQGLNHHEISTKAASTKAARHAGDDHDSAHDLLA
jgi:hypothetical protein